MIKASYIGGPTVILEIGGLRFITDPTLDPAGDAYTLGSIRLEKVQDPTTTNIGKIDFVLLSHDQHWDNLDRGGRALLEKVTHTYTTKVGAGRLGGNAVGMDPWESRTITAPDGSTITITATPARHGPAGIEKLAGDVIGFVLTVHGNDNQEIYLTGDTVYYEGVAEVAKRFHPQYLFAFAGAARTRGPFNLTMSANDVLDTAFAFPNATIIPLHFEGWKHFTQGQEDLARSFEAVGIAGRLRKLAPGINVLSSGPSK